MGVVLENKGSLATGKAGEGSAVMAVVFSDEWLLEGRESEEDMSRVGRETKVIADIFSFCRRWVLEIG